MNTQPIKDGYRLISECFLHPDRRDRERIEALGAIRDEWPPEVRRSIEEFEGEDLAWSASEYLQTLELSPPCPPYLGTYLFDEPGSCRGAGVSDRNGFLVELTNLYRHFGVEMTGNELPDFVSVVLEFAALTVDVDDEDDAAIRRYFLEELFRPGLEPFEDKLDEYESVYGALIEAVRRLVELDADAMPEVTAWQPPDDQPPRPEMKGDRLCGGPGSDEPPPCVPSFGKQDAG